MSGKWTRSPGGDDPVALVGIGILGIGAGVALGAIAVLGKNHLLSPHTRWASVPRALWLMRHYPIVWKPFTAGLMMGFALTVVAIAFTMYEQHKLHGDARWGSLRDIRQAGLLSQTGIILGRWNGKYLRFGGPYHVLLEAPTRAGKGVGVVIPNLLMWEDSAVVLDVKQENWPLTSGYRQKVLKQDVFLFNPFAPDGKTACFNFFGHIDRHNDIQVIDELQKIAAMLFIPPLKGEAFWIESARNAFLGVAAYVAATVRDGEDALPFTMGEIYRNFAGSDAKRRFPAITRQRAGAGKPLPPACVSALQDWCLSADNTFTSIRQSVTSKINLWVNPIVDAATSRSDFELTDFLKKRMTVYLGVTSDNIERVAPIYNLFFQQLIDRNTRELPSRAQKAVQLLMVLDEFPLLGRADKLASAFSYVAGYGIRMMPVIQDAAQLRDNYGSEKAHEIITGCKARLVLEVNDMDAAKEISELLGTYTYRAEARSNPTWGGKGGSTSQSDQRRPLMLPQEVRQMHAEDMIVLRAGFKPAHGKKIRYYDDKEMAAKARIPVPNIKPISFDPAIATRSLAIMEKALRGVGDRADAGAPVSEAPLEEKVVVQMGAGNAENWGVVMTQDLCAFSLTVPVKPITR